MNELDSLLASYHDLSWHLDPLRHPGAAPSELNSRLGRFDLPWLVAQEAALRSIAHAIEDLPDVESINDEIDRTMLINTVRSEMLRLDTAVHGPTADPGLPLRHAVAALDALMGEDFDAEREAALRARLQELPAFLAGLREEKRPESSFLVDAAQRTALELADRLDAASERLDDSAVAAARGELAEHAQWLSSPDREGGEPGLGEDAVLARLALLSNSPLGIRGTCRILELRRAGVERSLAGAAEELGYGTDWGAAIEALAEESPVEVLDAPDAWAEEWRRAGQELAAMGLETAEVAPPPMPRDDQLWLLSVRAVRARALLLLEQARLSQNRPVRRELVAPGLRDGWTRTVAALLRETALLGTPERRLASAWLALQEAVAAEADLLLAAREASPDELAVKVQGQTSLDPTLAADLVVAVAESPLEALAAGLAHEGLQEWFSDDGQDPVEFLRQAWAGGGLSVPLARWASQPVDH